MSGIYDAVGIALLVAFATVLLEGMGFRGAKLYSLVGVVVLYTIALTSVSGVIEMLEPIISEGTLRECAEGALRIVGISYMCTLCADVCRDMGEGGIANAVIAVGRVEILSVALPSVIGVVELAVGLIGG